MAKKICIVYVMALNKIAVKYSIEIILGNIDLGLPVICQHDFRITAAIEILGEVGSQQMALFTV